MGALGRLMTIIKAKLSRLIGKAENPNELLDYSYEKQLEMLTKVRKGIADIATSKARLRMQAKRLEDDVAKKDNQARQAIAQNREDLARLALERKKESQLQLRSLDDQIAQIQAEEDKLKNTETQLQRRVEQFRTRKETVKAQYTAAEAQVKIGEAVSGLSGEMGDVGMALERAEQKTQDMQARAMAVDELLASGALPDLTAPSDEIERELQKTGVDSEVELELAQMRKELEATSPDAEKPSEG